MLISILDGARCTTITHSDLLLSQTRAQLVECYYDYTQMEDINSGRPTIYFFPLKKKIKKSKKDLGDGLFKLQNSQKL